MIPHVLRTRMAVFAAATLLTSSLPLIADSPNILKIAVTRGGKVTANGKPTTLEDLDSIVVALPNIKARSGIITKRPKTTHTRSHSKYWISTSVTTSLSAFPANRITPTLSMAGASQFNPARFRRLDRVSPYFRRLRLAEQFRVFASPPSRPDATFPRVAWSPSHRALDRRSDYGASS